MPTSCSDAPGRPQVSMFHGQQESVPVHLSPLRVDDLSTRVHQAAAAHRSTVKAARCEATRVLRPLAYQSRYSGTGQTARPDNHQCAPVSRLDHQLREVRPHSKSRLPVHRDAVQHSTIHSGTPTEDASQGPVRSSALDDRPEHHSQWSAQASRHVGWCSWLSWYDEEDSIVIRSSSGPPQHGARGPGAGPTGSQFLSGFCQRWPGGHIQQSCKVYPSPPRRQKWLSSWMRPVRAGEPS